MSIVLAGISIYISLWLTFVFISMMIIFCCSVIDEINKHNRRSKEKE